MVIFVSAFSDRLGFLVLVFVDGGYVYFFFWDGWMDIRH